MSQWIPAFPLAELPPGGARLFKHGRERVAVWRTADGGVHAVDDGCPHDGYPHVKGDLRGATLTCGWHNYKVDLRDGSCLLGEEAVRVWPPRVVGDAIEIDVTPPDP